ncbi:pyruvate dehydrogenase kinase-like protein [Geopyxis carbonaria]|nr:pyruvate dehydrogenase kinase-like protein [Geopyxis carbonaria]
MRVPWPGFRCPLRPIHHHHHHHPRRIGALVQSSRFWTESAPLDQPAVKPTQFLPDPEASEADKVVRLAAKPLHRLDLADLVRFGRPPLSTQALLKSARFTRANLPIRLSRRILAFRNLPFIIVSNPHISRIFDNYRHSLQTILSFPPQHPTTLEEEVKFTTLLTEIVTTHQNTIPTLARGFLECRRYADSELVTTFLDQHLRERIGTRLMAEQHIALHVASTPDAAVAAVDPPAAGAPGSYIGTIDTALQPAALLQSCSAFVGDICELRYGVRPEIVIDEGSHVRFPYIPVHLEYILTELLKNAFRATVEAGSAEPVLVTIVKDPGGGGIAMRIRDRGGGISPDHWPKIWSYSFTTFDAESGIDAADALGRFNDSVSGSADGSSIAGLGYGLPLSRAYAEYFGGSLQIQSAYGWGTDVYLKLKGVAVE